MRSLPSGVLEIRGSYSNHRFWVHYFIKYLKNNYSYKTSFLRGINIQGLFWIMTQQSLRSGGESFQLLSTKKRHTGTILRAYLRVCLLQWPMDSFLGGSPQLCRSLNVRAISLLKIIEFGLDWRRSNIYIKIPDLNQRYLPHGRKPEYQPNRNHLVPERYSRVSTR